MAYNAKTDWKPTDQFTNEAANKMEQGIADAHTAIDTMQPALSNHETRIKALESSLANDMRDNRFAFDFSSTTGLKIVAGWVDESKGWLVIK